MTKRIDQINEREALAEQRRIADERTEIAQLTKPLPFQPGTRLFDAQACVFGGELVMNLTFGSEVFTRSLPNDATGRAFIAAYAANAQHRYGIAAQVVQS